MDEMFEFTIDLNMLRGDHVRSHLDFIDRPTLRVRYPAVGEGVFAVDEDGARYLAVIEDISDDGFVNLYIKLESRHPRIIVRFKQSPTEPTGTSEPIFAPGGSLTKALTTPEMV